MFDLFKGWLGESVVKAGLARGLDPNVYRAFHNVIVPTANGTTQIDHLLVSTFGIFVIETKNYKGWIFGSPEARQWCQTVYRRRSQFQNPLHQNQRHIRCLHEFLGITVGAMHSVVFFVGDCTFKTPMPPNVLTTGLCSFIASFERSRLNDLEIDTICRKLAELQADKSLTKKAHLHSLKVRYSSTTSCPKCSSPLLRRMAKKSGFAGQEFLGCSGYPRCRYTRNLPKTETSGKASSDSFLVRIFRFICGP